MAEQRLLWSVRRTAAAATARRIGRALLLLSLLVLPRGVHADSPAQPQVAATPTILTDGDWVFQQQPIVDVQVQVRDEADAALLRSLGYDCAIGVCPLQLPDGQELALLALGLSVEVVGRAVRATAQAAPASEVFLGSATGTDVPIPDSLSSGHCRGVSSRLTISSAPAAATVSRIVYSVDVVHTQVSQLTLGLDSSEGFVAVWDHYGEDTDSGWDDDLEDDADIELIGRSIASYFDGEPVNQTWSLEASDCNPGEVGYIDGWGIVVYFDCAGLTPGTPADPTPADGATTPTIAADLRWSPCANATSYEVWMGVLPLPDSMSKVATVPAPQYSTGVLACNTRYFWKIKAVNACGSVTGPVWDFLTPNPLPAVPATPTPADGASNVAQYLELHWSGSVPGTTYAVYLGTSLPAVEPLTLLGSTTGSTWPPVGDLALACSEHYYWRVVATNNCGDATGPLWDFTTACCPPYAPYDPAPADGTTNRPLDVDLDWADLPNANSYDVYFGLIPPLSYKGNTTSSSYPLDSLGCGMHYYWRVVARNACGTTEGPTWDFRTTSVIATPSGPTPADGATNRAITVDLHWTAVAGATSYTVRFGTSSTPPQLGTATASAYALPNLAWSTHYYWQIVAVSPCGNTVGPVWDFTTRAQSTPWKLYLPLVRRD